MYFTEGLIVLPNFSQKLNMVLFGSYLSLWYMLKLAGISHRWSFTIGIIFDVIFPGFSRLKCCAKFARNLLYSELKNEGVKTGNSLVHLELINSITAACSKVPPSKSLSFITIFNPLKIKNFIKIAVYQQFQIPELLN